MAARALLIFVIIAVAAIALTFYIEYRQQQTAKLAHITSLQQIEGVAPTVCTYQIGSFGTGSGGEMYIANGDIRIEIPDLANGNYSGNIEAVIGLDGTRTIDPKTKQILQNGGGVASELNTIITEAPWQCSPWWFSDNSLFTIPNAVTF